MIKRCQLKPATKGVMTEQKNNVNLPLVAAGDIWAFNCAENIVYSHCTAGNMDLIEFKCSNSQFRIVLLIIPVGHLQALMMLMQRV